MTILLALAMMGAPTVSEPAALRPLGRWWLRHRSVWPLHRLLHWRACVVCRAVWAAIGADAATAGSIEQGPGGGRRGFKTRESLSREGDTSEHDADTPTVLHRFRHHWPDRRDGDLRDV